VAAVGCAGNPSSSGGDGSNYYGGDPPASGDDDTGTTDGSAASPPDGGSGDTGSGDTGGSGGGDGSGSSSIPQGLTAPPSCSQNYHDVYSPFPANTQALIGPVSQYPWAAVDFGNFQMGQTIECGSNKGAVSYLDVTAGCLSAERFQQNPRGQIHTTADNYYRSFALPTSNGTPVKWTDQSVEYDFYFSKYTGTVSNPGFKLFARYLDEYDLYVASFREDGTAQIQKKECGEYTILKRIPNYGAPSLNQWHTSSSRRSATTCGSSSTAGSRSRCTTRRSPPARRASASTTPTAPTSITGRSARPKTSATGARYRRRRSRSMGSRG
jgi:hypothetical protein